MKNISIAGLGMYTFLVASLLKIVGVDVEQSTIDEAVLGLVTFVSFLLWVWGQLRRSDLYLGFKRK